MMTYIVISICIILLIIVIYISAKPISMGIEARRNTSNINSEEANIIEEDKTEFTPNQSEQINITDEITKLKNLKNEGVISNEEFEKAKKKNIGLSRFNFFLNKLWNFIFLVYYLILFTFWLKNNHKMKRTV